MRHLLLFLLLFEAKSRFREYKRVWGITQERTWASPIEESQGYTPQFDKQVTLEWVCILLGFRFYVFLFFSNLAPLGAFSIDRDCCLEYCQGIYCFLISFWATPAILWAYLLLAPEPG